MRANVRLRSRYALRLRSTKRAVCLYHLLGLTLCCLATRSHAIDRTWTGAVNNYWSEPGNWQPAGPPGNGDQLLFRAGGQRHDMINDLAGLSIRLLSFGFDGNDSNYRLSGNPLTLEPPGAGANIFSYPDGSSGITINCPLIFPNGGRIHAEPMEISLIFDDLAHIIVNGPVTVNQGELNLYLKGSDSLAGKRSAIELNGPISGNGDVRVKIDGDTDNAAVFGGSEANTFTGTLYLSAPVNSLVKLEKASGYVVTNRVEIFGTGTTRVQISQPNQISPLSTLAVIGGNLSLFGENVTVTRLEFLNDTLDSQAATLDTGATILTLLGSLSSSNYNSSFVPTLKGSLSLPADGQVFNITGSVYAGLDLQAQISGAGGLSKSGDGALLLKGNNTFSGNVVVNDGEIDLRNSNGLGVTTGGTSIGAGALVLRNVNVGQEPLLASGMGALGDLPGSVLTSIGISSWAGPVTLNTNLVVTGDMTFTGPISGSGGLGCFLGTIHLGGSSANTYTGTTLVRCPLLELNKPLGVAAYGGPLVVGGPTAGPYEARWLNSYQTPNTPVTLFANGILNLNDQVENFGPIIFNSGTVQTGAGYFIAENTITANPATSTAVINGNLALSVTPAYLIISNGVAEPDLQINAVISGANIRKQGQGTLSFTSQNTFTGVMSVEDGILHVDHPAALGSTTALANTVVGQNGTLRLSNVEGMSEYLELWGAGFQGINGALQTAADITIYSYIWLDDASTINVLLGGQLAVDNVISGSGPLTKTGRGNLYLGGKFGGVGNNSYTGNTIVNEGILYLSKNQGVLSVPGNLTAGPATASSPATARWLRTGTMPAGAIATANANSLLDLNSNNQLLAQLNLNDGGDAQTGAGTLSFSGSGSVNVSTLNPGQSGLQASASISGRIAAMTDDYLIFNIGPYGQSPLSPDPELVVSAQIVGTRSSIAKNGEGIMWLSGNNTFDGTASILTEFNINAGSVIAANNAALGGVNNWVYVINGASLALVNNIAINNKSLFLNTTNPAALDNRSGHNSWIGPVSFSRDSGINVNLNWSLTVQGTVSGSGSLTKRGAGLLRLGGSANNTHSGNTYVDEGGLYLTKFPGFQAVPANLIIGRPGGGTSAIVLHVNNDQIWHDITVNNGGLLNLNGYDEYVGKVTLNGGGDVQTGAGTLYVVTNLTVNPGGFADQSVISGRLGLFPGSLPVAVGAGVLGPNNADCLVTANIIQYSTSASLAKSGAGVLRLTGINTYQGATMLSEGTLWVEGNQPQSPVQAGAGTRLRGSGTIGHVTLNGSSSTIAPGASPGILTTSNFNAGALGSASLEIELNGTTPGSAHDQLNVRGTVNLTGLSLNATLGFPSAVSNQFTIINNDGSDVVTGAFTGLPQDASLTIGGESFFVSYTGGTGNDVVLTRLVTPPPPTLAIENLPSASVRLLWSTNAGGFNLQFSTNLTATNWSFASPLPVVTGASNVVTNVISELQRFYRLFKP